MAEPHPAVRLILDGFAGGPPLHELSVADMRATLRALAPFAGEPEPVATVEPWAVPGPGGPLPLRVYRPPGAEAGPRPVLVWFHGGGWVAGDLDFADPLCRRIANRGGCLVVSVGYRLAPEDPFPAAAEDAYAATREVAAALDSLGGDPARLAVGGDSAGGNLAAVTCLMARDRGGPPLAHQLLLYPILDAGRDHPSYREYGDGYFLTADLMAWYWRHYLGDGGTGDHPYASPLRAEPAGLPPAFVATAEFDPLRDEGEAYGERLGPGSEVRRYAGMIHGFASLAAVLDDGGRVLDDLAAVMRGLPTIPTRVSGPYR